MDAKCDVNDEGGSLNFNPGLDVGLGLGRGLYQDSSPTITFHEYAREGQRHKQSIDVSLRMTPEFHTAKEMHFKIDDEESLKRSRTVESLKSPSDHDAENSATEFHDIKWYSTTLKMAPHAIAHKCRTTLFVYPRDHTKKTYTANVDVYVRKPRRDSVDEGEETSEDESGDDDNRGLVNGHA